MSVRRTMVGVVVVVTALVVAGCGTEAAAVLGLRSPMGTYRAFDGAAGRAMNILPAGENGLVTARDFSAYSSQGIRPPNSADQVAPYNNLIYGASNLTDANLNDYYLDESFGVKPSSVVRTELPDAAIPVTIYRDRNDTPHIYGANLDAMAYGAGYAGAEDRLFLMDVLRHYGEGDLMSFVGDSCDYDSMDYQSIMSKGYTRAALQAQLDSMPARFGRVGSELVSMIEAYVAGVNRYIDLAAHRPSMMPFEYSALHTKPQPWHPTDVVAVSTLIALEATGGGAEVQNAALVQYLQAQFGPHQGMDVFDDLKEQNDPAAPTVIPTRFAYMVPSRVEPSLTAMPDRAPNSLDQLAGAPPKLTANCTGGGVSAQEQVSGGTSTSALSQQIAHSEAKAVGGAMTTASPDPVGPQANSGIGTGTSSESNAVVISAAHSTDGHPIAVFGPELGYYGPEILMQEDLHAPGYNAAGAAFPGANFLIELGRGTDYAWSATTASTDQVDMRAERLCNPEGGSPPPEGTDYEYKGRCLAMTSHSFSEFSAGPPASSIIRTLHYTVDGVVQGWTTVGGAPVAIVREDATTGHDLDQFAGYLQFGMPAISDTPTGWMHAADDVSYSFNWFYLNDRDIAYFVSGRDPIRNPHADPNLPTWGTGVAAWRGFLRFDQHPHAVDPPNGYFVSWNNKPAPGFSASDDLFAWGPVFRSQLLSRGLNGSLSAHGQKLDRAQVASVVEIAATQDLDAFSLVDSVVRLVGSDLATTTPGVEQMLNQLQQWAASGYHRRKETPAAVQYQTAAAVAIWDEVYPRIVEAFFDPVFAAGGVEAYMGLPDGYSRMPMLFTETPDDVGQHDGDGFYSGWEGYVLKAIDQLSGRYVAQPFSQALMGNLCRNGSNGSRAAAAIVQCRSVVIHAFEEAYASLLSANGGSPDVATWTQDTNTVTASANSGQRVTIPVFDQIQFQQVGAIALPSMDWQNRPTYQQVVEFPEHVGP